MKVVFINLKDTVGGAVIAMNRLAYGLESFPSIEQHFIVGRKKSTRHNIYPSRNRLQRIIEERIIDRSLSALGLQYAWFPFSSREILRLAKELRPDVFNIHLTHSGYFQTSLLIELSKIAPIVWTLHDMWAFTGNSAHTFGDESWTKLSNPAHLTKIYPEIGLNTGAWLLRRKKAIYSRSDLTIVTPSKWLWNLASRSPVFEGKQILHVNNGLDLNVFSPFPKAEGRDQLGIPRDATVLMFSAAYLKGDIWKGGAQLLDILQSLNEVITEKTHLLMIGTGVNESLRSLSNFVVHETGYIDGEEAMAKYLSVSDLFIYPTKADNLPNVLVEAISCGLPCVTFDIGGCAEIVIDGYNGVVRKPFDFSGAVQSILTLLNDKPKLLQMSGNARQHAVQNFSVESMSSSYKKIFDSVI